MTKRNILLLNPPGEELYLRGGYCSASSKSQYYYPAIDLLIQSGWLSENFEVEVLDAIATGLGFSKCLELIKGKAPFGVFFVTGHSSWRKDLDFARQIKEILPTTKIVASGGYLLENPAHYLRSYPFLDALLLDFTSSALKEYLSKGFAKSDLIYQEKGIIITTPLAKNNGISYPVPRHELFPLHKYHLPFARHKPMTVVQNSFGCPFRCQFCVFASFPFRPRKAENILEELRQIQKLRIREIFFSDPTFAADRETTMKICQTMIEEKMKLSWFCQSRADIMNADLLELMKKAGCTTIQFGIETTNPVLLAKYRKNSKVEKMAKVFQLCHEIGIRTLASIIIGLPGDNSDSIRKTVQDIISWGTDYASFNIAAPEVGTELRKYALAERYYRPVEDQLDSSRSEPTMDQPELPKELQWQLRNEAIRKFYFRPRYLLKRLFSIRSTLELKTHILEGIAVLESRSKIADKNQGKNQC